VQIHISANDPTPIYLQIVQQVKSQVAAGRLEPGEELPPIRTLAERLVVNPNTVARAYRELEVAGIVSTRRTAGTYISDHLPPRLNKSERLRLLNDRVDGLLFEARQMYITLNEVIELLQERDAHLTAEEMCDREISQRKEAEHA
jgi:GntR family transcriptional regulator